MNTAMEGYNYSNFYSQLVGIIEKKITAEGYTLITGFTNFKYEEEVRFLNLFAHKAVDGIILIRSSAYCQGNNSSS